MTDAATTRRMAAVGRRNTAPEVRVQRLVRRLGFRFGLHASDLPGAPDLVFSTRRKVIFVHGCFWHRHGCARTSTPRTRRRYWEEKFLRNQRRDRRSTKQLRRMGWGVMTVWECQLRNEARLGGRIVNFLNRQDTVRSSATSARRDSSTTR